jgi:hypothetical protein
LCWLSLHVLFNCPISQFNAILDRNNPAQVIIDPFMSI